MRGNIPQREMIRMNLLLKPQKHLIIKFQTSETGIPEVVNIYWGDDSPEVVRLAFAIERLFDPQNRELITENAINDNL